MSSALRVIALLLIGTSVTYADVVDLTATVQGDYALETGRPRSQKAEFTIEPQLEIDFPAGLRVTALGRMRVGAFDRLEPGVPTQASRSVLSKRALAGSNIEFELREAYLDGQVGRTLFRVGKQQIVWGQADGLKVLDVVNPQSFREFVLAPFDESRIPLWAVNLEIPIRDVTLQVVWQPDPTFHELAPAGGAYALGLPGGLLPPGVVLDVHPVDRPSNILKDSDAGARLSAFWHGWDLTVNYFYHYDDFPVPFREVDIPNATVRIRPGYERTHLVGGSFSNAFGDLTVRGEVGYSTRRFFPTSDLSTPGGVESSGELGYVLGLDWYGVEETLLSFQVFQTLLIGDAENLIRESIETTISFLIRREFWNDSLAAEALWIQSLDRAGGLLRPRVTYELRENLVLTAGYDWFYGDRSGLFGFLAPQSRLMFGFELGL